MDGSPRLISSTSRAAPSAPGVDAFRRRSTPCPSEAWCLVLSRASRLPVWVWSGEKEQHDVRTEAKIRKTNTRPFPLATFKRRYTKFSNGGRREAVPEATYQFAWGHDGKAHGWGWKPTGGKDQAPAPPRLPEEERPRMNMLEESLR